MREKLISITRNVKKITTKMEYQRKKKLRGKKWMQKTNVSNGLACSQLRDREKKHKCRRSARNEDESPSL